MNNNQLVIGENLRKIREQLKITQEEVGNRLGIGRDAIIRIEKGIRKVSAEELGAFAKLYKVKAGDIISGNINISDDIKGIILAGGSGTRLYPITEGTSKQLIPVYDKPMIYYPLSVLMEAGIRDILVITTPMDSESFKRLLGDGSKFGVNLQYATQPSPDGLAQAFIIGEKFIGNSSCAMVLGDNIFFGNGLRDELKKAKINAVNGNATIFGYQVKDPERFGIMEFKKDEDGIKVIGVEEKPEHPKSDYAITGLYFYPSGVAEKAKLVKPSARGELEITTLNDMYLKEGILKASLLGDGYTWFDTGTFESLLDAANMIKSVEYNKDTLVCSPEVIGYKNGWLSNDAFKERAELMHKNSYGKSLMKIYKKNNK